MYCCENTTEKGQWTRYKTWNKQTESEAWGSGYVILSKLSDRDKKQNGGKIEVDCHWVTRICSQVTESFPSSFGEHKGHEARLFRAAI